MNQVFVCHPWKSDFGAADWQQFHFSLFEIYEQDVKIAVSTVWKQQFILGHVLLFLNQTV